MLNNSKFQVIHENLFVLMPSRKPVVQTVPMGLIKNVGFTDHTFTNIFLRAAQSQHKEPALTNRKNYRQSCSEKVPEAGGN